MSSPDLLLAPGTRLLHIGPHKTGTTALQVAFHQARPTLAAHAVHYAGSTAQPYAAALAVAGGRPRPGDATPDMAQWERLVAEVRSSPADRVVISSEMFDDADDARAGRIVDDLGGASVHVVITLRPLVKILPSAWQQYVRNKQPAGYEQWLDAMFNTAPFRQPTPSFWHRHAHDELVARWVRIVGPERLTVIVVDEQNPTLLTRSFEELTGLPQGTLVPEANPRNRSLTYGEVELLRRVNIEFLEKGWPDFYYRDVRERLVREFQTRTPDAGEPRTPTPAWAVERAVERGARAAEQIAALRTHVVGDLAALGRPHSSRTDTPSTPTLPPEAALLGLIAMWHAMPPQGDDLAEHRPVNQVPVAVLARIVAGRLRSRADRELRRLRGGRGAAS